MARNGKKKAPVSMAGVFLCEGLLASLCIDCFVRPADF